MKTNLSPNFLLLLALVVAAGAVLAYVPGLSGIGTFVFVVLGWVIGLCLHEWGHAATASAFGDHTVEGRGYLSLDPVAYINGPTTIILPIIILIIGGIALPGAAVMIRPDLIRRRWQQSVVSLAGPLMSLLAALLAYTAGLITYALGGEAVLGDAIMLLAFFNLMAFVLNLLPVPGFDGFGVVAPLLPQPLRGWAEQLERMPLISLGAMVLIFFFGFGLVYGLMAVVANFFNLDFTTAFEAFDRFRFWR
ncbi:site-2 protease family protein [Asticcacaulis sp. YBE204]|uniref:site-2 protease family protein n=1 Tax=Asticcacaulis sp. YBE204 TaxID=1282363 RepID=UPI0003C3B109|nr:site-2 protease family protein [Asticcacaulis sp. YBE204]ESQ77364.1 hypothetical protein AEYBE204_17715 [Asticcacaulis sp. YBE204]